MREAITASSGLNSAGETFIVSAERKLPVIGTVMLRYGIVFLLLLWGAAKWTNDEALGIQQWMSHSPFTSWLYDILSVQGASIAIGVVELVVASMIASRHWLPRLSGIGSLLAIVMFLVTLSFLVSTPHNDPIPQGFLLKDLISLAAAVYTAGEAFQAYRLRSASTDHRSSKPVSH